MPKITVTAPDESKHTGYIPSDWSQVNLLAYAHLVAAETWPERCDAVAALSGLPAHVVQSDVSIAAAVLRAAPWLLNGALPAAAPAPAVLVHAGRRYAYVGAFDRLTGEQYEAISDFVAEAEAEGQNTVAIAHKLLAVLYAPLPQEPLPHKARRWLGIGQPVQATVLPALTADTVEATAKAFETLPVSVAYPIILDFFQRGSKLLAPIRLFSAVAPAALKALEALEQAQQASGSPASSWSLAHWLTQAWIRRAKRLCAISSTRFSITGKAAAKLRSQPINLN